jgi:EAL domain-containing protein (putative c-di-GMP-specific phosphodiesterase class I)
MSIVAEGVEDETTAGHLAASGCDESQGYYFSRPLPALELERWLAARGHPGSLGDLSGWAAREAPPTRALR